ncbi:response regulator [Azospirillum picis]|uniref:CheY-like chemotaxis protein n=1 Tax=Azospirillum picis TaxID=488438 RepID=A0ABU0MI55_9PROT|nr:response regulator [Azospirillum picis]MBP2299221.1 CheY-like chemotaxis protein [Azospirillum picis]MDQ0533141.1 CheY-like chemotaxis protein [Azospirillum picis]
MYRVLLVDDVEEARFSIASTLQRHGFHVTEAHDGLEALNFLAEGSFDAVITDIWMPKTDGLELLRVIKAMEHSPVVVAISGGAPKASIEFSVALADAWAADAVFIKPFDNTELVDKLNSLLLH